MVLTQGTFVTVTHDAPVPMRYRGRTGRVAGTTPRGRGFQYLVTFPGRRANPLAIPRRFVEAGG
jgi:hypothetical protein